MGTIFGILVRHGLTAIGGVTGYIGVMNSSDLDVAIGALSTLVGLGLSVYKKTKDAKKKAA